MSDHSEKWCPCARAPHADCAGKVSCPNCQCNVLRISFLSGMGRAYDLVEEVIHRLLIMYRAEGLDDGTEPLIQATYLLKLLGDLRAARGESVK